MRLISVAVRNYRVHRDTTVSFDASRTLIGGPNECGKSTLVEAVHRALFLRCKLSGKVQEGMVSNPFLGHPEVEVRFSTAGMEYTLTKRFSGSTGYAHLVQAGGQTWHGDEAESQLAALLKVEGVCGGQSAGKLLAEQWSHLWVWQGQAGGDPSDHANLQRGLLQRLQESGGGAALQSNLDDSLAKRFAEAAEMIFTQAGKPKVGSELEKAHSTASQAETIRQSASQRVENLRNAIQEFEDATQTIARADADLEKLKPQQEEFERRKKRVAELRTQEAAQLPGVDSATQKHDVLKKGDASISRLREEQQSLQSSLQPKIEETTRLEAQLTEARGNAAKSEQDHAAAVELSGSARRRRDLASAFVRRFEADARLKTLDAKSSKVVAHQNELTRLRDKLAKLPEVTAPGFKKLQRLEKDASEAEAVLKAMAAGVEVLAAEEAVKIGGKSFKAGQSHIVLEPTEIVVGKKLRLKISPGGGTSLQDAREQARQSRRELNDELAALGISNVEAASEARMRYDDLSGKIKSTEQALAALDADSLPTELAEARAADTAAQSDVDRRLPQVEDFTSPKTLASAREVESKANEKVEEAENAEKKAKRRHDAEKEKAASTETSLGDHQKSIKEQNDKLTGLTAQLGLLLETHGEDAPRRSALIETLNARNEAQSVLDSTRRELEKLQPALLDMDDERLTRACQEAQNARRDAEIKRAVSADELRSDGSENPQAELDLATARLQSARDHLASVRRKAEAFRLLDQLFREEQRSLSEQFTQPFAGRISAYLQCLFGAGARAAVTWADNKFCGLQLVRPKDNGGAIPFDALSGGAREQVAAAVRLAMAEVLAPDHDGCLPVVFDDAFAYSDPERVQVLQRMLDLAATNGLQVIVLSCNPSDYAALGARQIVLREERSASTKLPTGISETDDEGTSASNASLSASSQSDLASSTPVASEQWDALRSRLSELGGKSGNLALREALGWDEPTYNYVKEAMISDGELVAGRGRGGSVGLPDAL